jgi:hypothetical protein
MSLWTLVLVILCIYGWALAAINGWFLRSSYRAHDRALDLCREVIDNNRELLDLVHELNELNKP